MRSGTPTRRRSEGRQPHEHRQQATGGTGIEVEAAVRAANEKFRRRFRHVELAAAARGTALRDMTFEELDALWDAAKADERREKLA